jgi:hypothetical protein
VLYYNAATVEIFDLTTKASFGLLMPGEPGRLRRSLYVIGHGVRPDGKSYISSGPFEGDLSI